jgi:NADH-quinone oxidoreductase subunit H
MDWIIGLIFLLIKLLVILVGLLLVAAYLVLVERKFLARLQIRYGPNRAGKFGLLQPIADTVKMMVVTLPSGGAKYRWSLPISI